MDIDAKTGLIVPCGQGGSTYGIDIWYRLGVRRPKIAQLAPSRPTAPADRAALLHTITAAIPILGSTQAACRQAGVAQGTFYRWLDASAPAMRDEYASARRAIARQAIDAMAAICATASDRTLAHSDAEQEAHYAHHVSPMIRWQAERILPEFAPRSEPRVSVRIDIKSTLAKLLDTGDVIDADDLPALPAPDDYAGD